MTRRPRKDQTHCFHHVMVRGNNKQTIFFSSRDYRKALEFLQEALQKYQCKVHAFCLMSNHMHLLIETTEIPLRRIMQSFLARYAKWLNHTYNKIGHLFQGRYKAKKVITKAYFFELLYYIHNNPVEAGIIDSMSNYLWSSHNTYCGAQAIKWLCTDYLKTLISFNYGSYFYFIDTFKIENVEPIFCELDEDKYLSITQDSLEPIDDKLKQLGILSFEELCKTICEAIDFEPKNLNSTSQSVQSCLARAMVCYFAHFFANISLVYLSIQLERCPDQLSRNMYKYINAPKTGNVIIKIKRALEKSIANKQLFSNELQV